MKFLMVVLVVMSCTVGARANGVFVTGNKLHEWCSEYPVAALGFTVGVADQISTTQTAKNKSVCLPQDVILGQVRDVAVLTSKQRRLIGTSRSAYR